MGNTHQKNPRRRSRQTLNLKLKKHLYIENMRSQMQYGKAARPRVGVSASVKSENGDSSRDPGRTGDLDVRDINSRFKMLLSVMGQ